MAIQEQQKEEEEGDDPMPEPLMGQT